MTAEPTLGRELARAKVNLCLHVVGQQADGYHLLETLVVFPRLGDLIEASPGEGLSLSLDGPFGRDLSAGADNLVARAAAMLADHVGGAPGAALRLEKSLPIASGVGGGSADAAATLRLLARQWGVAAPLDEIALALGADGPMCLRQTPALATGVGERLAPAPAFPSFWIVLANPMTPSSTPEVYGALQRKTNPPLAKPPLRFVDFAHMVSWLSRSRNDLEDPARRLRPQISQVLSALRWDGACPLARMSGSGATCFGLYETREAALSAADRLRTAEPKWWVAAAPVEAWEG